MIQLKINVLATTRGIIIHKGKACYIKSNFSRGRLVKYMFYMSNSRSACSLSLRQGIFLISAGRSVQAGGGWVMKLSQCGHHQYRLNVQCLCKKSEVETSRLYGSFAKTQSKFNIHLKENLRQIKNAWNIVY